MNLEIRSVDAAGRFSVPTYVVGNVYGDRYREGLYQRAVLEQNFVAGQQLQLGLQNVSETMALMDCVSRIEIGMAAPRIP
jgi:hypothetical protein